MSQKIIYTGNLLKGENYNPTPCKTLGDKLIAEGYDLIRSSSKENISLRMLDMLTAIWKNRDADLVLIDTYSTLAFYYAFFSALLCRRLSMPYVLFIHGGDFEKRLLKSPKFSALLLNNASQIVCPSNFFIEKLRKYGYSAELIPNFLDLAEYPYRKRHKIAPRFFWLRAFHRIYNPLMTLEVFEIVAGQYPGAELYMVGPEKDDSLKEFLKKANAGPFYDSIHIFGYLSSSEWIPIAESCDFFLNTTLVDNTPVSVMEAMAMGMLVFSTEVGGIPHLISDGETGFLCPEGDAHTMAERILKLLGNPEHAALVSENARNMARDWDWESVREKWRVLFENIEKNP